MKNQTIKTDFMWYLSRCRKDATPQRFEEGARGKSGSFLAWQT
mgnify:CR=1 FL=1